MIEYFKELWCAFAHKRHFKHHQVEYGGLYIAVCRKCGHGHYVRR